MQRIVTPKPHSLPIFFFEKVINYIADEKLVKHMQKPASGSQTPKTELDKTKQIKKDIKKKKPIKSIM